MKKNVYDVIIEIPKHSNIKYEFDKKANRLRVDRILSLPLVYPYHYGYIDGTLAQDGDELDALVISNSSLDKLAPNVVISCEVVGLIHMEDEKGIDDKIICVPCGHNCEITDSIKKELLYFFSHYKDEEGYKWSKVFYYGTKEEAEETIKMSMINYQV
jgi:inorganic pyrophosphatase